MGLRTKQRGGTGRKPFTRGHLYALAANPLYVGAVAQKGATYPGRHAAIVDRDTFEAVQHQLAGNAAARYASTNAKAPSLLTGLVADETGDRLLPTHANKKGRRYRYYISQRLMHPIGSPGDGWRLPARELKPAALHSSVTSKRVSTRPGAEPLRALPHFRQHRWCWPRNWTTETFFEIRRCICGKRCLCGNGVRPKRRTSRTIFSVLCR
jgi:hypothetical protein